MWVDGEVESMMTARVLTLPLRSFTSDCWNPGFPESVSSAFCMVDCVA